MASLYFVRLCPFLRRQFAVESGYCINASFNRIISKGPKDKAMKKMKVYVLILSTSASFVIFTPTLGEGIIPGPVGFGSETRVHRTWLYK